MSDTLQDLPDGEAIADAAGLTYSDDEAPGIRRRRAGKGFSYAGLDGRPIRDAAVLDRIRKLAIPPAYTHVWISPEANGHIQATGRDDPRPQAVPLSPRALAGLLRDEGKFERMLRFQRACCPKHAQTASTKDMALATAYHARSRCWRRWCGCSRCHCHPRGQRRVRHAPINSYGLTTLRNRHVEVRAATCCKLEFKGKSGVLHRDWSCTTSGSRKHRASRCQDLPGQRTLPVGTTHDGQRHGVEFERRERLSARGDRRVSSPPRTSAPGRARWPPPRR